MPGWGAGVVWSRGWGGVGWRSRQANSHPACSFQYPGLVMGQITPLGPAPKIDN